MLKFYRYFIIFLIVQTVFHIIINYLGIADAGFSNSCLLDTCFDKEEQVFLRIVSQFYWLLLFITFMLLMTYNSFTAIFTVSTLGFLTTLTFGTMKGVSLDLAIIFGVTLIATPIGYFHFKERKSYDGVRLAPTFSITSFICGFPIAWIYRETINGSRVSKDWEVCLIIASILSGLAILMLLVAIYSKPPESGYKGIQIFKGSSNIKRKEKPETQINGYIVSIIYFGSLFINPSYIEKINPTIVVFEVILFWAIIYPILRKKNGWYKNIILVLYMVIFQLGLDAFIYQFIDMMIRSGEFLIILTDYVIILIYLCLFPLFKTLPQHLFLNRNANNSFLSLLKANFLNELVILLFILIKMNLLYYGI
jgi:hypothetical protein